MIMAAMFMAPHLSEPIVALAWGVLIAGAVQLAFQLPFLARIGLIPKPVLSLTSWRHPGVKRILKLMGPVIFGSSVAQINILLDTIIASFLAVGSLSWLYYSERLMQFPLGILGVALATVILPRLSLGATHNAHQDFSRTLDWAVKLTLLIGLPSAFGLLWLAAPLIATLFEYGNFTSTDTRMTSLSLMAYALGVPAFILTKVLLPGFFSRQDTRTPVRIGIIALVSNMLYNLMLVLPMVWLGFFAPHTGLAIASALSAWQQAYMLYRRLKEDNIYCFSDNLKHFSMRVLPALLVMSLVILGARAIVQPDAGWSELSAAQRALGLLGIISLAVISYASTLLLLGVRPREFRSRAYE